MPIKQKWYEINAAAGTADVLLYGEIGWEVDARQFARDLKSLGSLHTINVNIHSQGGSVADGHAIFTTLKNHPATVNVHIDSWALSMASVIAMAGDHIAMASNAMMMIHNPWGAAIGDAEELRKTADVMDKMKGTIVGAYVAKTGMTAEEIGALMDDETWMDAQEAKDWGFADEITGALEIAAVFDISRCGFNKAPARVKELAAKAAETSVETGITKQPKGDDMPVNDNAPTGETKVDNDKVKAEARAEALAAEKQRRGEIKAAFGPHAAGYTKLLDACLDDVDCTVDNAREKLLAELGKGVSPSQGDTRVEVVKDVRDKFRAGALNAIETRAGRGQVEAGNEFAGFTLLELARASLRAGNVSMAGMDKMRVVGAAFTHTSSDFPYLLENVIGKELQAAYGNFPETWRKIAEVGSVPDFKVNSRIRLGSFNSLDTIPEGGEYKSGTFGEERETIQAATKGKMISLTRQMIINDDLGGFMRLATMMGRAAARTVGNDVYSVITTNGLVADGENLFDADHASGSNFTSSGTAPTVAAVGAGRTLMRKQQDPNTNDYLDIHPATFLVPVALEDTARVLMASEADPTASGNSKKMNPVRNMAEVVSDPRLDANSATAWYLFADPNMVPVIEVAFLDGNQNPYLESEEGFTIDGVRWKVRLDYGTAARDWRGAYKNSGTGG